MTTVLLILGTIFGPSHLDPGNPDDHLACVSRRSQPSDEARRLLEQGRFVAAPASTLPCWAVLDLCVPRTGTCLQVTVADRLPQKKWRSTRDLDLWHTLGQELGHNGFEPISWRLAVPSDWDDPKPPWERSRRPPPGWRTPLLAER